jgi:hypothetical protein
MRKNNVTIAQFAPLNWVVERIGEIVKSKHSNLLTQSMAATHCKRHHIQLRAAISKQGQPLQLKCSHQQSRAAFDSHNNSKEKPLTNICSQGQLSAVKASNHQPLAVKGRHLYSRQNHQQSGAFKGSHQQSRADIGIQG